MITRHIIWDWNGTLLDDLPVVIEAANVSLGRIGHPPIDEDDYRNHFTRPVRAFYDSLLARPITDDEWNLLNETFHENYMAMSPEADLTSDTLEALDQAAGHGWGQSLLSMSPQAWLDNAVSSRGVFDRFTLVDGLRVETGGLKAVHMQEHVEALELVPEQVVVIGDTPDDAAAARHVGAQAILYDGGSHHLPHLQGTGVPIAHSLLEAVEIASGL